MTQRKVNLLLFVTVLIMAVGPMLVAFYFVDHALTTSLNLGFNDQVVDALDASASHLKELGRLDAEHRDRYRGDFEQIEALRRVYGSSAVIKQGVRHSLLIYFAVGVLLALTVSVIVAGLLSRAIANSYRARLTALNEQQTRIRYLEELSSWQELAKMLAHEIKNLLTPIEVMMTSLPKAQREQSVTEFGELLAKAEAMVLEELGHLKAVVDRFSRFAKLPAVHLATVELRSVLAQQIKAVSLMFESADIVLAVAGNSPPLRANVDAAMLRQVLVNLIRNGLEANPSRRVRFEVSVVVDQKIRIVVANNGLPVPHDVAARLFDPYISGRANKENMGLGLAIVRKIVLEHGGDVVYRESDGHPEFSINLPRAT